MAQTRPQQQDDDDSLAIVPGARAGTPTMEVGLVGGARHAAPAAHGRQRPRTRAFVAWTLAAIAAANAAVITWLWANGGNVAGLHTFGDVATSAGRLTGLLSAYLALIQVLLLARLPFLERLAGFDRLTLWHRVNGKACLYLVLAHVVFITLGYAAMDRIAVPPEVARLLDSYPGMVAATIGSALLILVVVTSLVIVRRRLPYEAWYLVHLTAYAGIALAWFHQIPTGNELTANPAASTYWTALYVVTLALLLVFRVVAPACQALYYGMRVAAVTVEGPGVVSLHITGRHLERLGARGGQFFLWRFLDRSRWWAAHPFSLSAVPDGRSLRITVKDAGDFSARIGAVAPGTRVVAEGPFGVFTAAARRRERVALIAGGIGITPIRAMLEELSGDVTLIYRVRREEDLVFRDELDALACGRGAALFYLVGDHRDPEAAHLLSPEHLRQLLPDIVERDVFICGPPGMLDALVRNVRRAGVAPAAIHTERFAL